MRASEEWLSKVDGWRRQQVKVPSRAEAIRTLTTLAIKLSDGKDTDLVPSRGGSDAK